MTDMTVNTPAGSASAARTRLTRRLRFGRSASGIDQAGWGRTITAAIVSFIYFFPVFWIILTAFKTYEDALAVPAKFFFTPTLDNFAQVFNRAYSLGGQAQNTGFTLYFFNSLFISGVSVLLALAIGTLAAFGFSRYPLKGNDTYLFMILTTRMLPAIVVIIPIFIMFRVTVTLRQPLFRLVTVPVTVGKGQNTSYTALRVAPDGVRVALVEDNAVLTFGAISGQQGPNPQITLSQVQLSPQDPATAFSGLAWYGPDNVIATATPGPVATEYSVSGGTPTPIPVEPGMQTITASYGNPLLAGMPDGSIVADVSLTGAWATLGKGVAPAYPG